MKWLCRSDFRSRSSMRSPSLIIFFLIACGLDFSQSEATMTESSPLFYSTSSVPFTWFNNSSLTTMTPADGSKMRVLLSRHQPISFACGFYCVGACNSYLFSIVGVGGGDWSLVWSANRDYPVKENATLQLTGDGGLVLQDSDGTQVWSTSVPANSMLGINLTEAGNLVLFGNEGAVVWQSFDHPSNVLLVRQKLNEGQKLIASSSTEIWNLGQYFATLTSDGGFAAFIDEDQPKPLMYYKLVPDHWSSNGTGSNYAELRQHDFLVNLGTSQVTSGRNSYEYSLHSSIKYMRLDVDGHLRIYQHSHMTGLRVIVDLITQDLGSCQYPLICGEYGVCKVDHSCSCPEDEDGIQYFKADIGCSRIAPLSCEPSLHHLLEVKNATYFNVIDSDAAFPEIKDIDKCKQACLQNCSCGGAFFRYEKNASDGYCFMPSKILSIREGHIANYTFTSAAFIKVQINILAPSPVPGGGRTTRDNSQPTSPSGDGDNIAAIVVGASIAPLITFCLVVVIVLATLKRTGTGEEGEDNTMDQVPGMPVKFLYEDLRAATEDFKERLGSGGFGSVFKGVLANGTSIAVKRLERTGQGMREFLAEVKAIGSLHHFNLVRLIGFCAEKSNRLLVFEYMSNGSLETWIFCGCQRPCLDWETRKRIILDIARGLAYIHEECRHRVIHLDIKPQNILLDENFNAKVSDFGLSELISRDESQLLTTRRGTPGYLAPEWSQSKVTVKVDTYSFGIVLLEIVTGRRNVDCTRGESSLQMLRVLQKKAEEDRLIDMVENLVEDMQDHGEEVVRMVRMGAWCLQDDPIRRPRMSVVVKALEGVMEVDPNIIYRFTHAMNSTPPSNDIVCTEPEASVLSNPR